MVVHMAVCGNVTSNGTYTNPILEVEGADP